MKKGILLVLLLLALVAGGLWYTLPKAPKVETVTNSESQVVLATADGLHVYPVTSDQFNALKEGYAPLNILRTYHIYGTYDQDADIVSIATRDHLIRIDMAYQTASDFGGGITYGAPKVVDGMTMIPLEAYGQRLNLVQAVNEDQQTIFLKHNKEPYYLTEAKGEVTLYPQPESLLMKLADLSPETKLIKGQVKENRVQVLTTAYELGWVDSDKLTEAQLNGQPRPVEVPMEEPILLTWDIYATAKNAKNIPQLKGVNVVSPTWYALKDDQGNISSKANQTYRDWARERGYQVWALVSNDFDIDRTRAFLYNTGARKNFIKSIVQEVDTYGFEGINIDFENVYKDDKDALTQFVAELSAVLRQKGVIVSMDVTVMGGSDNWSKSFDRAALGHVVDYLAIMTYDEHWASSPTSGSVSSYNWMKKHLEQIAEIVPKEKMLMGVPFYMRMWKETPSDTKVNTMSVKSAAFGMERAQEIIQEKNLNLIWDDTAKQYYAGWIEDGTLKKIWFEEARSIEAKASLYKDLDLAGIAAWRRGFETPDIWDVLYEVMEK